MTENIEMPTDADNVGDIPTPKLAGDSFYTDPGYEVDTTLVPNDPVVDMSTNVQVPAVKESLPNPTRILNFNILLAPGNTQQIIPADVNRKNLTISAVYTQTTDQFVMASAIDSFVSLDSLPFGIRPEGPTTLGRVMELDCHTGALYVHASALNTGNILIYAVVVTE